MRYILSVLLFSFVIGIIYPGTSSVAFAETEADSADQTTNDAEQKKKEKKEKKKKKKADGTEEEEPECDE
ncbi:MAG: hypothetical protein OEY89_15395 [Gammaproteobacteria bacterium]|nr:hypothetical protein [Gammaproteobacteria bacterium]